MRIGRVPVAPLVGQVVLLGALLALVHPHRAGTAIGVAGAVLGWVLLARALADHGRTGLGPADHVTVTRGTVTCVVAALTADSALESAPTTALVVLATMALALDAVDGWVARRTRTASALGARMDLEVDAFLILVLSVAAAQVLGWWVLAIGAFRYVFAVATWAVPWLAAAVAPRYWRKAVAALQGIVLTLATAQVLPGTAAAVLVALVLLAWSFGTQGVDAWRARPAHLEGSGRGSPPATAVGPATVPELAVAELAVAELAVAELAVAELAARPVRARP